MSVGSPEHVDIEMGAEAPFDREAATSRVVENGSLANTALRYAQKYSHSDDPATQQRYADWLSHPDTWDGYGMAA